MSKPDWKDAPEWATHLIIKTFGSDAGSYHWALHEGGREFRVEPGGLWYHPDGYNIVESRP